MDKALQGKVCDYRAAMSLVREMVGKGVLSAADYAIMSTILAEEYGLNSSTIFADGDLLSTGTDGNIPH